MADKPSSQKTADALFLLDALQHVTSTVMINAGEIAAQKDAKVNTIQKRFTTLKQRYNLNIQTTAVGSTLSTPPKAKPARVTKTPISTKTGSKQINSAKASAIIKQLEEESEERSAEAFAARSYGNDQEMRAFVERGDRMDGNVTEEDSYRV